MISRKLAALQFLVLACLCPHCALAQSDIKLHLSVPPEGIVYSAITVEASFVNVGTDDAVMSDNIDPEIFEVEVRDASDDGILYVGQPRIPRILKSHSPPDPLPRLRPGEKACYKIILACSWDKQHSSVGLPLFREPGKYKIRMKYGMVAIDTRGEHHISSESEFATIRIVLPEGEDAAALESIKAFSHPSWLLEPMEANFRRDAKAAGSIWETELTGFLQHHSKSRWLPYAHNALGVLYKAKAVLEKNSELAEQANLHLRIAADSKDFPLNPPN